jgi:hypothetical protein
LFLATTAANLVARALFAQHAPGALFIAANKVTRRGPPHSSP